MLRPVLFLAIVKNRFFRLLGRTKNVNFKNALVIASHKITAFYVFYTHFRRRIEAMIVFLDCFQKTTEFLRVDRFFYSKLARTF